MTKSFSKTITASDGWEVLFYLSNTEDFLPCLAMETRLDEISFTTLRLEHMINQSIESAMIALHQLNLEAADRVRAVAADIISQKNKITH